MKLSSPGVPDHCQGTEDEVYTLGDSDNCAPLDSGLLHDANSAQAPKFALTRLALALRRRLPRVFEVGSYWPLEVERPEQD